MSSMPVPYPGIPAADAGVPGLADQCVMCGLCLPHCPTYRLGRVEAEGPRGRIALARALTSGAMEATPSLVAHLDHCLGCLSCQKVCPSQVQYDEILVGTRAHLAAANPDRTTWLNDPQRLTRLARLGAITQAHRWLPLLARVLPSTSRWRRMAATLPPAPRPFAVTAPKPAAASGQRVALFRGCVASVYERDTLDAARVLLEACGHNVVELEGTRCCGALPRHAGDVARARHEADGTREALTASGATVVVTCSSGCHGDLRDEVAAGTDVRVVDVHAFFAADPAFAKLRFRARAARVALHLPCTQVNVVGALAQIRALLARIGELVVLELPEQPRCCGAAGSYFIEQPAIADRLQGEKLDQVDALAPDLLVTTNIGCRIHLGNGLRARTSAIPVLHPLALLVQQLDNSQP
jgi:glycolate oxidase iron-sulfur subunit